MFFKELPGDILFTLFSFITFFLINLLYRIIFLCLFKPHDINLFSVDMLYALYLGMRYDLRLSVIIVMPFLILSLIMKNRAIQNNLLMSIVFFYLLFWFFLLLVFYGVDISAYSYIYNRVNASLLMFIDTPDISFGMIFQTYPVIWIFLGLLVLAVFFVLYNSYLIKYIRNLKEFYAGRYIKLSYCIVCLLFLLLLHGRFSVRPLSWRDAYWTQDGFISSFTFNPVLYFYDSHRVEDYEFDEADIENAYKFLAQYFNVTDPEAQKHMSLARKGLPGQTFDKRPNIVIIMLETFASFKVGTMGNYLRASPNFDKLAEGGKLFTRFYIPMENTSRSIFSSFFGVPDIIDRGLSLKDKPLKRYSSIINMLEEHEIYYFIGGCASWGNIRGFLLDNINGLNLYEQNDYGSPVHDVWGISDLDLFYEANKVLRDGPEPFFAFIQTAGNHRPFKIPENNHGFKEKFVDSRKLRDNGFFSLKEYNSFRFLDHCLGFYFETAMEEDYFDNTVFIIYGDHGTRGGALDRRFGDLALSSFHVPFLIYAPGFFSVPSRIDTVANAMDMMPTIASLLGYEYENKGLGRDLLDKNIHRSPFAWTFTLFRNPPRFGLIMDDFYLNSDTEGNHYLFLYDANGGYGCIKDKYSEKAKYMQRMNTAIYEYSKFFLDRKGE